MKLRGNSLVFLIGWLILIVGGVSINRLSPLRQVSIVPVWVAARDLPANTQLSAEDLEPPDGLVDARNLPSLDGLVRKYLWEDITVGAKVKPSDLHDRPKVPDAAVAFIYPLSPEEIGIAKVLAPGDQVSVCAIGEIDGSPPCSGPLGVIAIHLGEESEESWLLLDVASQETELGSVLSAPQRFVLRRALMNADEP